MYPTMRTKHSTNPPRIAPHQLVELIYPLGERVITRWCVVREMPDEALAYVNARMLSDEEANFKLSQLRKFYNK